MKWFKHYTDAHEGDTIMQLWASGDSELIAFYWTLIEMIGKYGEADENFGKWTVNLATFKLKLGMNAQRSRKLLVKIGQTFKIEVTPISSESYQLFARNMLDIKETRGVKKVKSFVKDPGEDRSKKKEDRSKKKEQKEFLVADQTQLLHLPENNSPLADKEKIINEVIEELNAVAGTGFRKSPHVTKFIRARLNEPDPPTREEMIAVVRLKSFQWKDDSKMRQYLRPSTLFGPQKFENYLGEARAELKREAIDNELFGVKAAS